MNLFADYLLENKGNVYCKGGYTLQIYSDGINGNITRRNNTILCRFYIKRDKQEVQFSFAKKHCATEFEYSRYSISYSAGITEIKNIAHKDAIELCMVLTNFLESKK